MQQQQPVAARRRTPADSCAPRPRGAGITRAPSRATAERLAVAAAAIGDDHLVGMPRTEATVREPGRGVQGTE